MALNFYLNGTQIYAETNTTLTERVGTFDEGLLPLEITNVKNAILPMTTLTIENTTNNDKWHFVVISDSVEVVQKLPTLYKHNIVVRSKEYKLTKHLLRNNEFSQPKDNEYIGKLNFCVYTNEAATSETDYLYPSETSGVRKYAWKNISVNSRTKIARAVLICNSTLYSYSQKTVNYYSNIIGTNENAHTQAPVKIERYDSNVLVGTLTNPNLNTDISNENIFKNLTDTTEFRLAINYNSSFRFSSVQGNIGNLGNVRFELKLNTYFYSLLDIVRQIKKQVEKTYNGKTNAPVFALTSNAEKLSILENTIAPEISFTGTTIYQALYQLFSYIDAIPTIDNDGNLTFDYLNNNNQTPISIEKSDEKITLNDEYYTNKLVAVYQRGKQENAISYPALKKTARVSTRSYGVPSQNDYIIPLPKPIDYIDKVELSVGSISVSVQISSLTFGDIPITKVDITDQVVENSIYQVLDSFADFYATFQNTNNCFVYSKGGKYIDLLGNASLTLLTEQIYKYTIESAILFRFGKAFSSYSTIEYQVRYNINDMAEKYDLKYYVEYHAMFDGKVEQVSTTNKYDGETYVNQETSNVSLNRMGNNLQGLIAKVGNEAENITIGVSSYGSRMRAGSLWVDDDGNRYIANVVKTTFSSSEDNVIVEAEFTRNFNLISQYTKVDQEKRFYEIASEITSKGYDNITEYLLFTYTQPTTFTYDESSINKYALKTIIERTLKHDAPTNYRTCDYATFRPYTNENDGLTAIQNFIYIPLHIYGSGNSLCFEMDFDSSINAGNRLTGSANLYTKTTLYTDEIGFADKVDVRGYHSNNTNYLGENFPLIDYNTVVNNDQSCFGLIYNYYKKPNEIFHLNYALAFIGDDFYFGNQFIEQNGIMANNRVPNEMRLYKSNGQYSIIDNKILDGAEQVAISSITYTYIDADASRTYLHITITASSNFSCKSWALADENGNIYVASNKVITDSNVINIYIIPKRNRI